MLKSMSLVSLDTLAIARKMQAVGFSDVQADAVTGVLRNARESDLTTLVTKSDLSSEIALVRSDLKAEIALVRWILVPRLPSPCPSLGPELPTRGKRS